VTFEFLSLLAFDADRSYTIQRVGTIYEDVIFQLMFWAGHIYAVWPIISPV
jgi:hypothetical protein